MPDSAPRSSKGMAWDPRFTTQVISTADLKDMRCPGCGRLIMKHAIRTGSRVEVKCPRCNEVTRIEFK